MTSDPSNLPFFNEQAANIVQFLSLPLEIYGLILILVELKNPKLAKEWEAKLDKMAENPSQNFSSYFEFIGYFSVPFFLFILYIAINHYGTAIGVIILSILAAWIGSSIIGWFFTILAVAYYPHIHRFANGHSIGAIGLFLAALGALGEVYQVFALIFN